MLTGSLLHTPTSVYSVRLSVSECLCHSKIANIQVLSLSKRILHSYSKLFYFYISFLLILCIFSSSISFYFLSNWIWAHTYCHFSLKIFFPKDIFPLFVFSTTNYTSLKYTCRQVILCINIISGCKGGITKYCLWKRRNLIWLRTESWLSIYGGIKLSCIFLQWDSSVIQPLSWIAMPPTKIIYGVLWRFVSLPLD